MSMDQFLAEHFGTNDTVKTASAEDLEKQATVELFMKLAQEQNIDLKSMPAEQVNALFANWVKAAEAAETTTPEAAKVASEEDKKKELEAKAEKELEEKKAYAEKCAEAEYMGRIMAHSYVSEMKKIAEAAATGAAPEKVAEIPEAFRKNMEAKKEDKGEKDKGEKGEKGEKEKDEKKEASATDQLAFVRAQELAKEAGLDPAVAAERIKAAFVLGLVEESTKTASAANAAAAVEIRALELLERVGYPVQWTA